MEDEVPTELNSTYNGAWNEICQRISARGQFNIYHAYVIVALAGVYVTYITNPPNETGLADIEFSILILSTSTFFVWLIQHNERILGLLSALCAEVERQRHERRIAAGLSDFAPTWFFHAENASGLGLQTMALDARIFSDRVTAAVCLASPVLSIFGLIQKSQYDFLHVGFAIALSAWAIWLITVSLLTSRKRSALAKTRFDRVTGQWG